MDTATGVGAKRILLVWGGRPGGRTEALRAAVVDGIRSIDAPVELRLVGQDIDALRLAGDDLRARLAEVSTVAMLRTGIAGGSPKLTLEIDEARARLLGLDLGQVARQMEAGLEGVTGGSLLEGTEELPVRVRLGAGLRGDLVAIGDMPILPPGAAAVAGAGHFPAVPLSTLGP
jgi:multidrug efflux pump subunit AcrB